MTRASSPASPGPAPKAEVTEMVRGLVEQLEPLGPAFASELVAQLVRPRGASTWLTPAQLRATYRQVWIARTAAGAEVLAVLTSHRRSGGGRSQWHGVNLVSGRPVRITKLLKGSKR